MVVMPFRYFLLLQYLVRTNIALDLKAPSSLSSDEFQDILNYDPQIQESYTVKRHRKSSRNLPILADFDDEFVELPKVRSKSADFYITLPSSSATLTTSSSSSSWSSAASTSTPSGLSVATTESFVSKSKSNFQSTKANQNTIQKRLHYSEHLKKQALNSSSYSQAKKGSDNWQGACLVILVAGPKGLPFSSSERMKRFKAKAVDCLVYTLIDPRQTKLALKLVKRQSHVISHTMSELTSSTDTHNHGWITRISHFVKQTSKNRIWRALTVAHVVHSDCEYSGLFKDAQVKGSETTLFIQGEGLMYGSGKIVLDTFKNAAMWASVSILPPSLLPRNENASVSTQECSQYIKGSAMLKRVCKPDVLVDSTDKLSLGKCSCNGPLGQARLVDLPTPRVIAKPNSVNIFAVLGGYLYHAAACPSLHHKKISIVTDPKPITPNAQVVTYHAYEALCFQKTELITDGNCSIKSASTMSSTPYNYRQSVHVDAFKAVIPTKYSTSSLCSNISSYERVLVIPSVLKGMNNQRMRFVQDLASARLIGISAVQLPSFLNSRANCSNHLSCYKEYVSSTVKFWDVFDMETTVNLLLENGLCVLNDAMASILISKSVIPKSFPLSAPYSTSELLKNAHFGKQNQVLQTSGEFKVLALSLGSHTDCCSRLIPNTQNSIELLQSMNFALVSSNLVSNLADNVILALKHERNRSPMLVALHWRQDDDFMISDHELSGSRYLTAVVDMLKKMADHYHFQSSNQNNVLHVLLLGDIDSQRLQTIENQLTDKVLIPMIFHTKLSLLPKFDWEGTFQNADDYKSQVDFEIGVKAPIFVGSPFSSMSVLIAVKRDSISSRKSLVKNEEEEEEDSFWSTKSWMLEVDVKDELAKIFKIHFPYGLTNEESGQPDRCQQLGQLSPAFNKFQDQTCPFVNRITIGDSARSIYKEKYDKLSDDKCEEELAPKFQFAIPLDDPAYHNGNTCQAAVVTTLFGTKDTLYGYHNEMDPLRETEMLNGVFTCWVAFLDEEAVAHTLGLYKNNASTSSVCALPKVTRFGIWQIVAVPLESLPFDEVNKKSRIPKMLMHRAFKHASQLIYIDSKVIWTSIEAIWNMFHRYAEMPHIAWVSPRHPFRTNAFEEARCVYLVKLAEGGEVLKQMKRYHQDGMHVPSSSHEARGFPYGLIEGEWHYRNLKHSASSLIGCNWFREFSLWNHGRDQLSFNYVLWNISRNTDLPFNQKQPYFDYVNFRSSPFYRLPRVAGEQRLPAKLCLLEHKDDPVAEEILGLGTVNR